IVDGREQLLHLGLREGGARRAGREGQQDGREADEDVCADRHGAPVLCLVQPKWGMGTTGRNRAARSEGYSAASPVMIVMRTTANTSRPPCTASFTWSDMRM